jgi:hypothetical protein
MFLWDLGSDVHLHWGSAEAVLSFRGGQTVLLSDTSLLRSGKQATVVVPSGGETGNKTAQFWEGGATLRYHIQPLHVLHEQNGLTAPAFEMGYGWRNDSRFKKEGDNVVFADPWKRSYFRFMIRGVPVGGLGSSDEEKGRLLKLTFGVDHEWGGTAPKSTRFFMQGDLDLVKAIRGH